MKKIITILLAMITILSLCACGVSLTPEQEAARKDADELLSRLADVEPGSKWESEVEEKDGKLLYIGTIDFNANFTALNAVQNSVMPTLKVILSEEGMYPVLYIKERGKDLYRLLDPALDSAILD